MKPRLLPFKNLASRPGRSGLLLALIWFLTLTLFCGSVVALSLGRGLNSLENRLGADIIVLPASAKSKVDVKNLYLQGTTGYYYMDAAKLDRVRQVEGVAQASPQIFLASLRAECCSVPVQVIGFDPATDFTVQPWIARRVSGTIGQNELVAGSSVSTQVGDILRIYGVGCRVIARLDETGTGLDTAVYCTNDTMAGLLKAARELGHELKISGDPAGVVSAIYVKLREGADASRALVELSHISKVTAVETKSVISSVSDSLRGFSGTMKGMIAAVWILCFALLALCFALQAASRRGEFAALRIVGYSRRMLLGTVLREALTLALAGGIAGILLGAFGMIEFSPLLESALGLPFLLPDAGSLLLIAALSLFAVCVACPLAAALCAAKLSTIDIAAMLREGN